MRDNKLLPSVIERCLPQSLNMELASLIGSGRVRAEDISEIRLRAGRPSSITHMGQNIPLNERLTPQELSECVVKLCRGSVYAHAGTIRAGYIRTDGGVRIGVCGTLAADGRAVAEISSLNIRIPHIIRGVSDRLMKFCWEPPYIRSLLIYSPPGVGKTTVLRDIAARLGGELARRVALIDTRGELYMEKMFSDTLCDVLIGYPRALGIEIATRTLCPEVLICDELGDADEARQLLTAQNTGVPIIASAHAANIAELLARPSIHMLHDAGVFSGYVGLSRETVNGRMARSFVCNYTPREEACRYPT